MVYQTCIINVKFIFISKQFQPPVNTINFYTWLSTEGFIYFITHTCVYALTIICVYFQSIKYVEMGFVMRWLSAHGKVLSTYYNISNINKAHGPNGDKHFDYNNDLEGLVTSIINKLYRGKKQTLIIIR